MNKISVPNKFIPAILAALVLAAGLGGIVYFKLFPFGQAVPQGPVTVTAAPIGTINKAEEIVLPGSVQSRQAVIISAEISGQLSELSVAEGQLVKAGQLLAHIEGSSESAGTEPANTVPPIPNESTQQQAQANYDKLEKEYERYQKLYQVGGIARKQFEDVAARLQAAREALSSSIGSPDAVPAGSSSVRQPSSANLTAPSSGKVTGLSVANGKTVQAGQQLMVLDNGGDVRVVVHLEQKDLYLVYAGTPVEIFVAGSENQPLTGQVEAIYPEGGTDKPLFLAHIRVDNSNGLLKSEIPVQVHLKTGQSVAVRAVPRSAVIHEQELNYLYLAIDGKAVKQQVTTGVTINDFVEITSSLPEQALVITKGITNLKDGDELTLQ